MEQVENKLCSGITESYIKQKRQLDHVIKSNPCKSPKAKLDMTEVMLYGNHLESWKLWRQTEEVVEVEKISGKRIMGLNTRRKFPGVIELKHSRLV